MNQINKLSHETHDAPRPTRQQRTEQLARLAQVKRFDVLGKLSWLWMNSPLHRDWPQATAARFLIPPVALGQYELIERDGMPVAYCSWAWLSGEAEMRYMLDSSVIQPQDWNGGDRLWFADWVAPFSAADSLALRHALAERFPHDVARAIRVRRGTTNARVMEFKGNKLPRDMARERLRGYHGEFLQRIQGAQAAAATSAAMSVTSAAAQAVRPLQEMAAPG